MVKYIRHDLEFILDQIIIAERHAAGEDLTDLIANSSLPLGLRTVDGTFNNLVPGQENFGAANQVFPRLLDPNFRDAEAGTSYDQDTGLVIDSTPRTISNLIVDQTTDNPAAVAAAERDGSVAFDHDNDPSTPDLHFIPNQAPDEGLSAPFNSWMTFFGQFFDHGLDLVDKGSSGTVFIPLQEDDPLFVPGSPTNFMVLTRATNQPGPDGIVGTADDIHEHTNDTTPFVDQNQTYTSHPSHQVFLREYVLNDDGEPVATGKLIQGQSGGMATWGDVKAQAATLLGIQLDDFDALDVPLVATDQYGNFIPGANGLPQLVVNETTLLEGDLNSPIDATQALRTGHAALVDIAHTANPGTTDAPLGEDADDVAGNDPEAGTYDNELLDAHFIAGDGRANENVGLTTVHHVFHSEHNRLVEHTQDVILESNDLEFLSSWLLDGTAPATFPISQAEIDALEWNGERLFQAAKFGTEMQYQHLVFEEFARKIQPAINVFGSIDTTIDPTIVAEFAHTVYRFGHSMLTETVDFMDTDGNLTEVGLIEAFLNPLGFHQAVNTDGTVDANAPAYDPDATAGAVVRGMTRQVGNEIDEFVTDALRNNLLGLPLDLAAINIARGRDTGIPSLNEARTQFFEDTANTKLKPYDSWFDFALNLKNEASIVNFIAAYGTHQTILDATTLDEKRAAALDIVLGDANGEPADRIDFLNGTGVWATTETGLNNVDFWVGGLAESIEPFGGMLGSSFNFVFETQLENLQEGDRFYYLARTAGLNFLTQLEQNSFAGLIMRNTDLDIDETALDSNARHLPGDIFSTPGFILEVNQANQVTNLDEAGADGVQGTADDEVGADGIAGNSDPIGESEIIPEVIRRDTDNDGDDDFLQYTGGEHVVLGGTNEDDTLIGGIGDDTLWGDGGNDRLEGGDGGDIIIGGSGDDIITDKGGLDNLQGGDGNDAIAGSAGEDLILAGAGNDFVVAGPDLAETFGGEGNDFINAGGDANIVFGGEGDDWIEGGDGNNLLIGENGAIFADSTIIGNDVFIGSGGDDDNDAESGDDIMVGSAGSDRYEGMFGFDWVTYKDDTFGVDADLTLRAFDERPIPASNATIIDRFDQVEGLSGSAEADILRGDDADTLEFANTQGTLTNFALIDGLRVGDNPDFDDVALFDSSVTSFDAGNIILGGDGSDIIEGRGGDDIIDGDAWLNVQLEAPDGQGGTVRANTMSELQTRVFAGELNPGDIEIIREIRIDNNGVDFDTAVFSDIRGNYAVEGSVNGLGAEDIDGDGWITIEHLAPAGDITGGVDGIDRVRNIERLQFSNQTVIVNGAEGLNAGPEGVPTIDDITPQIGQLLTVSTDGVTDADNVSATNPTGALTGPIAITWQVEEDAGTGIFIDLLNEAGIGTGGNAVPFSGPTLTVPAEAAGLAIRARVLYQDANGVLETVFSAPTTPTANQTTGTAAADILIGTAEADVIDGLGGNDTISGLGGNDILNGGTGADTINGDGGNDILNGDAGSDTLNGGAGADQINGGTGDDEINGDGGSDVLDGGAGDDTIVGGAGLDTLLGDDGSDDLSGGAGVDNLDGGDGDDVLDGGGSADTLTGGRGDDEIDGGASANDLAVFSGDLAEYSITTNNGVTTVTHLNNGQDGTDTLVNVEFLQFADQTVDVNGTPTGGINGTAGDDVLNGTAGDDVINGLAGDDDLTGLGGNDTLNGGDGFDLLIGNAGNDTLNGDAGTDILDGGAGNDELNGGDDNDDLEGGDGDDTLDGGAGTADIAIFSGDLAEYEIVTDANGVTTVTHLNGGADGVDTLTNVELLEFADQTINTPPFDPGTGPINGTAGDDNLVGTGQADIINGLAGDDTIVGDNGDDTITGGAGNDTIDGENGTGDIAVFSGALADYTVVTDASGVTTVTHLNGGADGVDTLTNVELLQFSDQTINTPPFDPGTGPINGTAGDDILAGTAGDDEINGLGGDDDITGGAGNDTINAGDGFDLVEGGDGDDIINGEGGPDILIGDAGNDQLNGGDGDDDLEGGAGNDTLDGGAGTADIAIFSGDLADYEIVTDANGVTTVTHLNGGTDGVDTLTNVELLEFADQTINTPPFDPTPGPINGTAGDDNLVGTGEADIINGLGGDDTIVGDNGDDTITGGAGNDTIDGENGTGDIAVFSGALADYTVVTDASGVTTVTHLNGGADGVDTLTNVELLQFSDQTINTPPFDPGTGPINGTAGDDILAGTAGDDEINGLGGDDDITGGDGNDTINAGDGFDLVEGGDGDDIINGEGGPDILIGDAGNDQLNGGDGDDDLEGGDGDDTLDGGVGTADIAIFSGDLAEYEIVTDANGVTTVTHLNGGADGVDTLTNVELLEFADQTINTPPFDPTPGPINGTAGDDNLVGTGEADIINGLGGDDTIVGDNGDDTITGGAGNDTIDGENGTGDIAVFSGALADYTVVTDASGVTTVTHLNGGADGVDTLTNVELLQFSDQTINTPPFDPGTGPINGTAGDDILAGTAGDDEINGLGGDDDITGGAGNDTINAGDGFDLVEGGDGDDIINGEGGPDILIGDAGNDQLNGGDGDDDLEGGDGDDTLDGGVGTADIAIFSGDLAEYEIVTDANGVTTVTHLNGGTDGVDTLTNVELLEFADQTIDTPPFVQGPINGTEGNDTLTGTEGDDVINGLGGNDDMDGRGGNDTLNGGAGFDLLIGGDGNDTLNGNAGADILMGDAGNDILDGGDGLSDLAVFTDLIGNYEITTDENGVTTVVHLNGGADGTDTITNVERLEFTDTTIDTPVFEPGPITGTAGNDTLVGTADADTIQGLAGDDTIQGEGGDDTLDGGAGDDTIDGGAGDLDTALFTDLFANYEVVTDENGVTTVQHLNGGIDGTDTLTNVEQLTFSDQTIDTPAHVPDPGGPNEITGTDGNDTYVGTEGDDIYIISQGNDTIQGYEKGVDKIHFGDNGATSIEDLWGSLSDNSEGYLVIGDFNGNRVTIEGVTSWDQFDIDDMTF